MHMACHISFTAVVCFSSLNLLYNLTHLWTNHLHILNVFLVRIYGQYQYALRLPLYIHTLHLIYDVVRIYKIIVHQFYGQISLRIYFCLVVTMAMLTSAMHRLSDIVDAIMCQKYSSRYCQENCPSLVQRDMKNVVRANVQTSTNLLTSVIDNSWWKIKLNIPNSAEPSVYVKQNGFDYKKLRSSIKKLHKNDARTTYNFKGTFVIIMCILNGVPIIYNTKKTTWTGLRHIPRCSSMFRTGGLTEIKTLGLNGRSVDGTGLTIIYDAVSVIISNAQSTGYTKWKYPGVVVIYDILSKLRSHANLA